MMIIDEKMKRSFNWHLWVLVVVLMWSMAGCSVKEERQDCPCRLMLDLSAVDTSLVKVLNVQAVSADGVVFSDTLASPKFDEIYVRNVPHRDVRVLVWGSHEAEDRLLIPYGNDCPALYMDAFDADTRGEKYFKKVELRKNHCLLSVNFEGREEIPYSLTFRGNVNGYDSYGLPSEGDFSCVVYPGNDGGSMVVVPRQTDSSMLLDVEDPGSSVLKTFAIGEYMERSGYDWTKADLEDAEVVIDYCITGFKIVFKGWDKEYIYDIIL